ncbi:MAG TPA: sugar phosphate isomerase/epimerase family protein, partial [Pseudobdellovibrionaceae bacterium]
RHKITALEVAPTKYWSDLKSVSELSILHKKNQIEKLGLEIIAAQSLLFGRAELSVFGETAEVQKTITYLKRVIDVCALLGCKNVVFGSPKNRLKGPRSFAEACHEVAPVFIELAQHAEHRGLCFCIEPNAAAYGCDFVTTLTEALFLIEKVKHSHFGLHLDIGNIIMAGENLEDSLRLGLGHAKHLHISAPQLVPIYHLDQSVSDEAWQLLTQYPLCLSVEMLIKGSPEQIPAELNKSLQFLLRKLRGTSSQ